MRARSSAASGIVAPVSVTLCVVTGYCGNLYPDPSFEETGEPGVARTGERAGHLRVAAEEHWVALGGTIEVEPFATYRVTVWAKGRAAKGTMYAPYCYEWNNFVWSFTHTTALKPSGDWQQLSATFVSPYDHMVVHPLAFLDCADAEAWVDDVVVEQVKAPAETMAAMMAQPGPGSSELEIIARYRLAQGDRAAAEALIGPGPAGSSADIACLLALQSPDPDVRRRYAAEMVKYGGLALNWGTRRFSEITEGMADEERLSICVEAVLADPGSTVAARGYRMIAESLVPDARGASTLAEAEDRLRAFEDSQQKLLAALPADAASRTEVAAVSEKIEDARETLAGMRESLGRCTVRIGGEAVTPETHAIAVPDEPTPQEEHAARDLRHHLELVTGKAIPLVAESEVGDRTPIIVGKCGLLEGYAFDVVPAELGAEGIYIATKGPVLALVGNKRGVLYACYTFLEDCVGCRWFAPDCSTWPTDGTIKVPKLHRVYIPPLEYRTTDYPNSRDPDWAVRNKNNGNLPPLDEARGGHITYQGFVHTFNALVPPDRHFDEHPEWFSEIDGTRVKDRTQLCLTNKELLEFVKGRVREWVEQNPSATIISVSQNDWHNYCQCASCSALAEDEGSQSGPLIHFVNAIADDIKDDYPDIIIDTLAYQYTRKPPKHVKPHPNVAVRLCSIECCFIHPLATDPFNASFVDDIKGWSRICNRLHIWDYVINYAHTIMPFPNLYVLKPNIDFFVNHGVTGIYEEACYYTKGAELAELRTYIMAKTLWDPTYDTDRAIDEFCAAYYGPAAPYIREYIDVVQESAQSIPGMHVRIYSPPTIGYLTPEVLDRSRRLFDQAERAVRDDPTLLHRVQVARLPVLYSRIMLAQSPLYVERDDKLVSRASLDTSRLLRRFQRIARAEGVTKVREGGPLAPLDAWLEAVPKSGKGYGIGRLRNGALEVVILPALGGRIWRMRLLPSGRDIMKVYGEENAWDPSLGGYEEYSTADYRSPGWSEEYKVSEKTDRSIALTADLSNGLKLSRTIELDAEKPVLRITSELANPSGGKKTACLRIHPAFQVETTQQADVALRLADGSTRTISLANPEDPMAEKSVWLRGDDIPAGRWAVNDREAGLSVEATFDRTPIERCLLNWNGQDGRVNLELFSHQRDLAAGETIAIEHAYEGVPGASGANG